MTADSTKTKRKLMWNCKTLDRNPGLTLKDHTSVEANPKEYPADYKKTDPQNG